MARYEQLSIYKNLFDLTVYIEGIVKNFNRIESDIMRAFKSEWRRQINIRQGKKEEKLVVSFKDRSELKDLIRRLSRVL